jgi:hypothetical protein
MKRRLVTLCLLGVAAATPRPVSYDVYGGYFVSNRFEPDAPASFVVLRDQQEFDRIFGIAMVMSDRSHRLPAGIFATHRVVAAIRRGPAVVEYRVQSVAVEDDALVVRYATVSTPSESATFACPLILSVPRDGYARVRFIENGEAVGSAVAETAPSWEIRCREEGTLAATVDGGRALLSIRGGHGIGSAEVRRGSAEWPAEIRLRAHLRGLEHLAITVGRERLVAAVASHGDYARRIRLCHADRDGPSLDRNSPCWMDILAFGPDGTPTRGLPPDGGWFEMRIPSALLDAGDTLKLEWVDFYR